MSPRFSALRRLLIYAAMVLVALPAESRWLAARLRGMDEAAIYVADHLIQLVAVLLFGTIAAHVERRPFGAFGLPWREALRSRFWAGAAAGIGALAVLMLALAAAGGMRLEMSRTPAFVTVGFGAAYALVFALLAMREEFLYRGYGQFTLTQVAGFWPAAIATSAWFLVTHTSNRGENPIGLANVGLFGLIACLTLQRSGSLWLAIGFHAAWDWGQTYLFGVADSGYDAAPGHWLTARVPDSVPAWLSGGAAGPEGSALCVALLVLIGIGCARWLRRSAG